MNLTDVTQRVEWLDREHRRNESQLAHLVEDTSSQQQQIADLAKRQESLEGRLAAVQAQLVQFSQVQAALHQLRDELVVIFDGRDRARQQADEHLGHRLDQYAAQIPALTKAIQDVNERIEALSPRMVELDRRADDYGSAVAEMNRHVQGVEARLAQTQARALDLQSRVEQQSEQAASLARELQMAQAQIVSTHAQVVKFPQIEEALQVVKNELILQMRELELKWHETERAAALLRQKDREDAARALAEVTAALETIPRLEERINPLSLEDKRLRDALVQIQVELPGLAREVEQKTAPIPFIQKNLDSLTARVTPLEAKFDPLHKADEELAAKIRFLEEWAQRSADSLQELDRFEDEMRRSQRELAEAERFRDDARNKRITALETEMAGHRQEMDKWRAELRRFSEAFDACRRTLADIEALGQTLQQDQKQAMEIQRLDTERQQREMKEWEQAYEKRFNLFVKQREWDWAEQAKRDKGQDARLDQLEVWRQTDLNDAAALRKQVNAQHDEHIAHIAELWQDHEMTARKRLADAKKRLDEVATKGPKKK